MKKYIGGILWVLFLFTLGITFFGWGIDCAFPLYNINFLLVLQIIIWFALSIATLISCAMLCVDMIINDREKYGLPTLFKEIIRCMNVNEKQSENE